jgi:hypothetical protein
MKYKDLFTKTLKISIIIQIISGILEIFTLFIKVPTKLLLIRQLLFLEVIVQIVEAIFYLWLFYNLNNVLDITPKRYIDWALTTPVMLVTLIIYLIYLTDKDRTISQSLDVFTVFYENWYYISIILILNSLMLLFGYLGEAKIIPTLTGVVLGFIPFMIYYYLIYTQYVSENKEGIRLFLYFFFFWSLYGIAAVLPYYLKNSLYNILDLFAKNFFGIFLSYIILTGI